MDAPEHHAALNAAIDRLAATEASGLDTAVPTCPGWTVARLITHVGRIHAWAALAITTPAGDDVPTTPRPEHGQDPVAWFVEQARELSAAIAGADLDDPVPSWVGTTTVRWWLRRLAHETTLHAWDAQDATGTADPIPAPIAVDGVDEVLDVFLPIRFDLDAFAPDRETVHLHAEDISGEWLLTFTATGVDIERAHAKGDVAARGPAEALLRLLWNRIHIDELTTFGDVSILERLQSAARY